MSRETSDPIVRLAGEADMEAIAGIVNWAILNTWSNFSETATTVEAELEEWRSDGDAYPWLVGELDGTGVGFARATRWKGRCAYRWGVESTVYIHPEHHGLGLGRAIYGRLLEVLRRQGYHSAIGAIALPNEASVRLHESLGMAHVGTLRRIGHKFGRWHDVGYWQIQLNDGDPRGIRPVARCF
jgi:L-amino acid N-acyltransferase YncA